MRAIPSLLLAGLLSAGASAQLISIPDNTFLVEGPTALVSDWRGANRYQVIYSAAILTRLPDLTVREIQVRPDGGTAFPARSLFVTVTMSSQGVPSPERADRGSFANNLGTDTTVVFDRKLVNFPAMPGGGGPINLHVPLVLDRTFRYFRWSNLLIQVDFEPAPGQTIPNPWYLDGFEYPLTGWSGATGSFGTPCAASGDLRVLLASFPSPINGLPVGQINWRFTSDAPVGLPGVLALGFSNTRFGALPLPLPLASLGAQGCFLYNDVASVLGAQSLPSGNGSLYYAFAQVPRDFQLTGLRAFGQFLLLDPTANPFGLRASQGSFFSLDTPPSPVLGTTIRGTPLGNVSMVRENVVPVLRLGGS